MKITALQRVVRERHGQTAEAVHSKHVLAMSPSTVSAQPESKRQDLSASPQFMAVSAEALTPKGDCSFVRRSFQAPPPPPAADEAELAVALSIQTPELLETPRFTGTVK